MVGEARGGGFEGFRAIFNQNLAKLSRQGCIQGWDLGTLERELQCAVESLSFGPG